MAEERSGSSRPPRRSGGSSGSPRSYTRGPRSQGSGSRDLGGYYRRNEDRREERPGRDDTGDVDRDRRSSSRGFDRSGDRREYGSRSGGRSGGGRPARGSSSYRRNDRDGRPSGERREREERYPRRERDDRPPRDREDRGERYPRREDRLRRDRDDRSGGYSRQDRGGHSREDRGGYSREDRGGYTRSSRDGDSYRGGRSGGQSRGSGSWSPRRDDTRRGDRDSQDSSGARSRYSLDRSDRGERRSFSSREDRGFSDRRETRTRDGEGFSTREPRSRSDRAYGDRREGHSESGRAYRGDSSRGERRDFRDDRRDPRGDDRRESGWQRSTRGEFRRDTAARRTLRDEDRELRPGLAPRDDEPEIPEISEDAKMPRGLRAELKGVSAEIADAVGAYMMKAAKLVDEDPHLAYRHAEAARRRAPRLPLTREAAAETAYAAGLYEEALAHYRTLKRMTGNADLYPVMVDCLRAVGKHRAALELGDQGKKEITNPSMIVELVIVMAGVRADMGQRDEAKRMLRQEMEHPSVRHPRQAQARLLYTYADMLAHDGDHEEAYHWFSVSASVDPDATSALDRMDEFDGVMLDLDETEFVEDESENDSNETEDDSGETEDDSGETEDTKQWEDSVVADDSMDPAITAQGDGESGVEQGDGESAAAQADGESAAAQADE